MPDVEDRYRRACDLLPAVASRRTAGNAIDGYWLDDRHYFYLAEALDPAIDRVLDTPTLVDAETGALEALIAPAELFALLARHGFAGTLADLADAHFDLPQRDRLAVTIAGRTWLIDPVARAVLGEEDSSDPAIHSPDGSHAVVLDGENIALRDRTSGAIRRLTTDGVPDAPIGQHPQTGVNAVAYRRRPTPLGVWSADSRWFLTHRIDEGGLHERTLVENAPAGGGGPVAHRFKAPLPFGPLPQVTIVAIEVATGRIVTAQTMDMPIYAPVLQRTAWFATRDIVAYLWSDRHLRRHELVTLDLATGTERVLLSETTETGYLEYHPLIGWAPNVRLLSDTNEAIWWSERNGWGHLYLYDTVTGAVKNAITAGAWQVRDIVHVDGARRRILFTRCGQPGGSDYQNRELCAVNFDGTEFAVVVSEPGHDVAVRGGPIAPVGQEWPHRPSLTSPCVSPDARFVVVRTTNALVGNRTEIVRLDTGARVPLCAHDPAFDNGPVAPRLLDLTAANGTTPLKALLFLPSDFDPARSYPLLDLFYPGPQLSFQPRTYNSRIGFLARAFAELGMAVVIADSRALPFRSRDLHQCGYPQVSAPQVADQAAVIAQLCRDHPFLDETRVGVLGFSSGGEATLHALLDYPDTFQVGVAINGSYDPRNIIAVWPNKYIGPADAGVIDGQDISRRADRLQGRLLLVAADMDENVDIANTFKVADALVRANKDFELVVVPNQGHVMMLNDGYTTRRVFDFLAREMLGQTPPLGVELRFENYQVARMAKAAGLDGLWS